MSKTPQNTATNTIIYILKCPITLQIRYVGKTVKSLRDRMYDHMYNRKYDRSYRANWIKSLKRMGLKPIVEKVDECPWNESQELEIYWIYKLKYEGCKLVNNTIGGEGTVGKIMSKESRARLSKSKRSISKIIYQYSMGGSFIREWSGYIEAAKDLQLEVNNISNCCYGRRKSCGDFRWSFNLVDKLEDYKINIIQYNMDGNLIAGYPRIKEASESNNINASHISECCKGLRKSAGGFKWEYKRDDIKLNLNEEEIN